jgi:type I restriction enzyme R subunit
VITDAIKDENVLRFSVEYWGKLRRRDGTLVDDQVASIDTKEFFENPERIGNVVDWIIQNHGRKTHNKDFTAILAVGSIDALIAYYDSFSAKKQGNADDLRIVTIFTYGINEDDQDADGLIGEPDFNIESTNSRNVHSRDKLQEFIRDYNQLYNTKFSARDSESFYAYYKDIAKRIKERDKKGFNEKDRVDVLLVVNMYLTGFDAKKVNTLYVDKNLRYHGLVQAYSRTNRILSEVKSQGNIVCFRNLKANTDEAIALFSNKDASEEILIEPYEDYVVRFNEGVEVLRSIAPHIQSVDALKSEYEELQFIRAFRNLIRILNVLKSFSQFAFFQLDLEEQEFEDYKSKYLDLFDKARSQQDGEKQASIIHDIDFELELIQRDEINVAYILRLLAELKLDEQSESDGIRREANDRRKSILDMLGSETQLRSKRELIERFINEQMPQIATSAGVEGAFAEFWQKERDTAFEAMCVEEGLDRNSTKTLIEQYQFTGRMPLREQIVAALSSKPKILERKTIVERITEKLMSLIKTYDDNIGDI